MMAHSEANKERSADRSQIGNSTVFGSLFAVDVNFANCEDCLCGSSAERPFERRRLGTANGARLSMPGTRSRKMQIGRTLPRFGAVGEIQMWSEGLLFLI